MVKSELCELRRRIIYWNESTLFWLDEWAKDRETGNNGNPDECEYDFQNAKATHAKEIETYKNTVIGL